MKNLTMIPSIGEALNPAQTLPALMLDHGSDEDAVAVEICDACFAQPDSSAKSNNFNSDPIPQRAWRLTAVLILVAFAVLSVASARAQPLRNYRLPGNVGIRMTASLASAGQIDDQLDKFIEIIGDLKGNATICNVEKSQHALLYEETINNANLVLTKTWRKRVSERLIRKSKSHTRQTSARQIADLSACSKYLLLIDQWPVRPSSSSVDPIRSLPGRPTVATGSLRTQPMMTFRQFLSLGLSVR